MISDHARAQLLYRLVGPSDQLRKDIVVAVGDLAQVEFTLEIPFVRLRAFDGIPSMVAKFTTDIPALSNWGEPLLIGPGSIHVAHTEGEYVSKSSSRRPWICTAISRRNSSHPRISGRHPEPCQGFACTMHEPSLAGRLLPAEALDYLDVYPDAELPVARVLLVFAFCHASTHSLV